jgi:HlyD family secretion protein
MGSVQRFLSHLFVVGVLTASMGCGERIELRATSVTKGTVESVVSSVNSGTVRAEQQAELSFGAVGRVQALGIKLGDRVKHGAILAELENSDLKASLDFMRRESVRRKELAAKKLISASEFEEISRQIEQASSALEKTVIRAPFDGVVTELNLEVGQLSQITAVIPKPLVRLIDEAPRYVRAEIDELDLNKIKVGQPARVKVLATRAKPFTAEVRQVVPFISTIKEQDRTAEIELNVEAEGGLLPVGASADVEVILETKTNVLVAPARAILGKREARYVFKLEDGYARKTDVQVGISGYDLTEVTKGLAENDQVLIPSDEVDLQDGARVTVKR